MRPITAYFWRLMVMLAMVQTVNGETLTMDDTPLPPEQIDGIILERIHSGNVFDWNEASPLIVWSATVHGDRRVAIGYQPSDYQGELENEIHKVNVQDERWSNARSSLIHFIVTRLEQTTGNAVSVNDLQVEEHPGLPFLVLSLENPVVLSELRELPTVRYLEPIGYRSSVYREVFGDAAADSSPDHVLFSNPILGCSESPKTPGSQDWIGLPKYNTGASWSYRSNRILEAWAESAGEGITIAVLDTGVSSQQSLLGNAFATGDSTNRTIVKRNFLDSEPSDPCGHGTTLIGLIAAPYQGRESVGIAYKSNIISARVAEDVIINWEHEKKATIGAYYAMGGDPDVDIITMSLGDLFRDSRIADAIGYAKKEGKLIFNAAGSSLPLEMVIFPASLSTTVAVTGLNAPGPQLEGCGGCFRGKEVDFATVVHKPTPNLEGPLTLSRQDRMLTETGYSSGATAAMAGVAALVWAKNPLLSANQVLALLRVNSSRGTNRHPKYGWGIVDAEAAVKSVVGPCSDLSGDYEYMNGRGYGRVIQSGDNLTIFQRWEDGDEYLTFAQKKGTKLTGGSAQVRQNGQPMDSTIRFNDYSAQVNKNCSFTSSSSNIVVSPAKAPSAATSGACSGDYSYLDGRGYVRVMQSGDRFTMIFRWEDGDEYWAVMTKKQDRLDGVSGQVRINGNVAPSPSFKQWSATLRQDCSFLGASGIVYSKR